MDVLTSETCWALNNEIIGKWHQVGLSLFNYFKVFNYASKWSHYGLLKRVLNPLSGVLLEKLTAGQIVKKFPAFMEHEDSLPHSQVSATCRYPEPARSSPYPTYHLLKIYLNIILPSVPGSPMWTLSLRFPHQYPEYDTRFPHKRYMPRPSHSSRIYHPNNIWWTVQIIKLLIMQFSPLPCYLVRLRPKTCFKSNTKVLCTGLL